MPTRDKWATEQIRVLVACGVSLVNAQAAISFALSRTPASADLDTYVIHADLLVQDVSSPVLVADARNDWYQEEHIPLHYKRLLDAR